MKRARSVILCVDSCNWTESAIDRSVSVSRALKAKLGVVLADDGALEALGELSCVNAVSGLSTRPFDRRAMRAAIRSEVRGFREALDRRTIDGATNTPIEIHSGSVRDFVTRFTRTGDLVVLSTRSGALQRREHWELAREATRCGALALMEASSPATGDEVVAIVGPDGSEDVVAMASSLAAAQNRKSVKLESGHDMVQLARRPWLIVVNTTVATAIPRISRSGAAVLLVP